jgi:hypothetical protein
MIIAVATAGCVVPGTDAVATADKLQRRAADLKVLLMPADIVLAEVTAGGMTEVNAEWTAAAKEYSQIALKDFLEKRNAQLVAYQEPSDPEQARLNEQLVKLHAAVGASIVLHQFLSPLQLPSKKTGFHWSLGSDVRALAIENGADYALFVHIQDSYASAGRVAAQVFMAVLFGVAVPGGVQSGYASLVDLRTGEIVWFNRLARGTGDMRKPEAARETVEFLMSKFPT